jgi:hypothetical protein
MAVLDEAPGVRVTIQIDNQDFTEYIDLDASKRNSGMDFKCLIIAKYIQAIDDAEFGINVAIEDDKYAWGGINLTAWVAESSLMENRSVA